MKTLFLYDTTLRDGTQAEGVNFSLPDKLRVARRLDAFGMDYIEGGWPGSNPKDIAFFEAAAKETWSHAKIAAFGSTRRAGLPVAEDAQVGLLIVAQTPVVTIYGKSWGLHVAEVLRTTAEENRAMIADTVRFLKEHGKEVIYDAEHFFDGYKDDPRHALATLQAAHEAGADVLALCETNGGALPHDIAAAVRAVRAALPDAKIGIHTHDDAGFAAANALAAILEGAVQIQGTMNGYGERAGNCNLTTMIPTLQLKLNHALVPDLTRLRELSLFVDELANCPHNLRAPYVGAACFAHKGGTHVNAVQKLARSYEHIEPALVGNQRNILVSELSGQSNVLMKAEEMGLGLTKGSEHVRTILQRVKDLEAAGYEFEAAGASFALLIRRALKTHKTLFDLHEYRCDFHSMASLGHQICEASVKLSVAGQVRHEIADGHGPVDALAQALRKALEPFHPALAQVKLTDYKVRILDGKTGTAAKTRVLIESTDGQTAWGTVGVSENIIEASWLALVDSFEHHLQE